MTLSALKNKLDNPRIVMIVWGIFTVVAVLMKSLRDPEKYNNFLIFRGVTDHLFGSLPLYGPYPLEYGDVNHYGPIFGVIIAPFAALPPWLGVALWIVAISAVLYWAVRELPLSVRLTSLVLWIAANDLFTAQLMQQFNIVVAALIVGGFAAVERRREGWAALFIVIGIFVKIYGVVGLAAFFFVKRKWRFIGFMTLWSLVALLLPLIWVTPEYLLMQYIGWFRDITEKNGENMFALYQNVSFVGSIRKISGCATYSDLWIVVPAMVAFLLSYLRIGQYKNLCFRLNILASVLLFIVLFSSGSENSGYIIAAVGVGIWWVTLRRRSWLEWTLLVLMLVATFARNLFPWNFYYNVIFAYALRSVPYFLIWLHGVGRLWLEDFSRTDDAVCGTERLRTGLAE